MREGTGQRRVKVVERGGESIRDRLCRNNPWGSTRCERDKCIICPHSKEGRGGMCRREGVVYKITCSKCEEGGVRAEYWGETARTGFERGEEHLAGLESQYEKNSLWKHSLLHHNGTLGLEDLRMEIVESHRSPLNRQVHEGVELDTNRADLILNSKSEWNHCRIPRIMIEVGDEVEEDSTNGMARSTELGGKERGRRGMKIKLQEKRSTEETGATKSKRQRREGDVVATLVRGVGGREPEPHHRYRTGGKNRRGGTRKKQEAGDLESGERLMGWIKAYDISQEMEKVKGAENHVERIRGEKVEVKSGGFSFMFRKTTDEKIKNQVREINERERERKRKREELYMTMRRRELVSGEQEERGKAEKESDKKQSKPKNNLGSE